MGRHVRTVVRFALFSRVLTLVLQALFNALIPDHAADAFAPPRAEEAGPLDPAVEVLLGGLSRWDAEHFLFIAERGYLYEHNSAFLPLLPLSLRLLAGTLLLPLAGWLTARGRLLLAAAGMNAALFVLSAVALYGLGRVTLGDRRLALLSSLLFCLTPANVFLTAAYSEGLFSALTFGGLWLLETGAPLRACLALSLATATRANGLANAGFLVYLPLRGALAQARAGGSRSGWRGSLSASCSRPRWAPPPSRSRSPSSSTTATGRSARPRRSPARCPPRCWSWLGSKVTGSRTPRARPPPGAPTASRCSTPTSRTCTGTWASCATSSSGRRPTSCWRCPWARWLPRRSGATPRRAPPSSCASGCGGRGRGRRNRRLDS